MNNIEIKERYCGYCNKVLIKREQDSNYAFAKRKYCGRKCANLKVNTEKRVAHDADKNPYCEHCNKTLVRRDNEEYGAFVRRRFCSISCSNQREKSKIDPQVCMHCNELYYPKSYALPKAFKKRKFCSRTCSRTHLEHKRIAGEIGVKQFKCKECGLLLPKEKFYKDDNIARGFRAKCISCTQLKNKEYRINPPSYEGFKTCTKCGLDKHVTKFTPFKGGSLGRQSMCHKCHGDYLKERKRTNPGFKIKLNLRSRISQAVKHRYKAAPTMKLVGCSIEFLMEHLESQFRPGMSFDNYGEWHIDHIIPCDAYDLTDPEQQKECFHYTNLQPLWAEDNLKKSNKILQTENK